ncbi:flavoprotein [Anaeroselena agilis]|uniref:Flavoprotein n=1 Tax=Anaeroselena agilis TaxID=3063788 RepID=A0ABU3NS83_9FIRM|nr:flavoprotein [Selenomonadales bacterium 4137-cl]
MQYRELVDIVTQEVLRRLNGGAPAAGRGDSRKILALFCGGAIGLEPGLAALAELRAYPADVAVVLSAAAEKIVGAERVRDTLGTDTVIVTAQDPYPGRLLREADAVVVPVLTQNTAAKLARTFSDTLVTTLALQALMLGKPVVMAANAADPQDCGRTSGGMGRAPVNLTRALRDNLRLIESYGVRLVDVKMLAAEVGRCFRPDPEPATLAREKKVLIDAAAVKAALATGSGRLAVPRGAIITPLAADAARELNVELVRGDS